MKILVPMILAGFFLATGCNKSSADNNNTTKTNTQKVTSSAWYYDNAKIDFDNNGTGDASIPAGTLQPCQTDNVLTFSANGTGTIDEGGAKCNAADPQTNPFTWTFGNNETTINFSSAIFAGLGGDFKIIALTDTQLALSKQLTIPPSTTPVTVIAYFKH